MSFPQIPSMDPWVGLDVWWALPWTEGIQRDSEGFRGMSTSLDWDGNQNLLDLSVLASVIDIWERSPRSVAQSLELKQFQTGRDGIFFFFLLIPQRSVEAVGTK